MQQQITGIRPSLRFLGLGIERVRLSGFRCISYSKDGYLKKPVFRDRERSVERDELWWMCIVSAYLTSLLPFLVTIPCFVTAQTTLSSLLVHVGRAGLIPQSLPG